MFGEETGGYGLLFGGNSSNVCQNNGQGDVGRRICRRAYCQARTGSRPKGQKHQMSTLALVELDAFRISQLR